MRSVFSKFRRRAFTLIELLVVIAIMAILMATTLPMIPALNDQARVATCQSRQEQVKVGLRLYAEDHRRFPDRLQELYDGRYLENPALFRCDKIGAEFYYRPVPLNAPGETVLLACCDPAAEAGKRPHRNGAAVVQTPLHGGAAVVNR